MSRFHVALALAALVVVSGCTIPGGSLTAEANPASVDKSALDATGYAVDESATIALNETVGIEGEDREVGVKNHIETYARNENAFDNSRRNYCGGSTLHPNSKLRNSY